MMFQMEINLGVPRYEVSNGELDIYYNYGNSKLIAGENEWHVVNDKSKTVADKKLDSKILKGVIIFQTSKDENN